MCAPFYMLKHNNVGGLDISIFFLQFLILVARVLKQVGGSCPISAYQSTKMFTHHTLLWWAHILVGAHKLLVWFASFATNIINKYPGVNIKQEFGSGGVDKLIIFIDLWTD